MKSPILAACRRVAGGAVNGRTLVGGEDGNLQMRLMRARLSLGNRITAAGRGDPEPFVRCEAGDEKAAPRVHLSTHASKVDTVLALFVEGGRLVVLASASLEAHGVHRSRSAGRDGVIALLLAAFGTFHFIFRHPRVWSRNLRRPDRARTHVALCFREIERGRDLSAATTVDAVAPFKKKLIKARANCGP
jgi:hypothetical protein